MCVLSGESKRETFFKILHVQCQGRNEKIVKDLFSVFFSCVHCAFRGGFENFTLSF